MAKRLTLDLELPEDLLAQFQEKEIAAKAKEALVMELLENIGFPKEKLPNC